MLRTETVYSETLELLTSLMQNRLLDCFFLVGGTALSLQIGHRMSIDLDLFSVLSFEKNELLESLEKKHGSGRFSLEKYRTKAFGDDK